MSLQAGHKLAHYEILEPIGKGGMGEVYRARDGKLGRDVAIKVLPDEFAENEERLARFKREAKVLASLNHPNIASIYGLEQSDSTHYLVLELVPGETLAERISRGPIPLEEALDIAPDGQRFLMVKPEGAPIGDATASPELVLIQNWFDELERLAPN